MAEWIDISEVGCSSLLWLSWASLMHEKAFLNCEGASLKCEKAEYCQLDDYCLLLSLVHHHTAVSFLVSNHQP